MPSFLGHAAGAWAISNLFKLKQPITGWLVFAGIILSILPDIDVFAFQFNIPYEHLFGHRGITHSIAFAVVAAALTTLFFRKSNLPWHAVFGFLFLATLSHSLLDACTTGERGVALFAPFSNERIFLPWQVIRVSPLSVSKFFSEHGLTVVKSEFLWIGIPVIVTFLLLIIKRKAVKG